MGNTKWCSYFELLLIVPHMKVIAIQQRQIDCWRRVQDPCVYPMLGNQEQARQADEAYDAKEKDDEASSPPASAHGISK